MTLHRKSDFAETEPRAFPQDRLSWGAMICILVAVLLPVWQGGNRLPAQVVAASAILIALLLCIRFQSQASLPELLRMPMAGLAALLTYCAIQAATWSIEPGRSWDFILQAGLLLIAIPVAVAPGSRRPLLDLLLVGAAVNAAFGLAAQILGVRSLGLFEKTDYLEWVSGTFVNRNAAADFFVLGALLSIARIAMARSLRTRVVSSVALFILLAALAGTGSRGGVVVGGLCIAGCATMLAKRHRILVVAGSVCLALLGATILLVQRTGAFESSAARFALWSDAVTAIALRPWGGFGAGTYPTISILFRSPSVPPGLTWDSSHSVYLDAAATLGIPAAVLASIVVIGLAVRLFRLHDPLALAMGFGTLHLLIHAIFDFSPVTPAILVLFAVAVGMAARARSAS